MFGKNWMHYPVAAFAVVIMSSQAMAEPQGISFSELRDPAALIYEDPFQDMGLQMLEELRTVVRLEARFEQGDIPEDAQERLMTSLEDARKRLRDNGHDIDALLTQRWTVAENRKRATTATNPELENAYVRMNGFLIPAGSNDAGFPIAYLVPEIGMCSHKPAPPPNQLVRVLLKELSPVNTPYVMVQVSGTLRAHPSDETIFISDGETRMHSMWQLNAKDVVAATGFANRVTLDGWQELLQTKTLARTSPDAD